MNHRPGREGPWISDQEEGGSMDCQPGMKGPYGCRLGREGPLTGDRGGMVNGLSTGEGGSMDCRPGREGP